MTPQELKDSIIRLAMQGKLVEQRAAEGNAHTLRLSIDADRKQKVQNKTVKENKKIEPITEEDIPFDIPDSWEWIRFGEMVFYNMGKTPPRAELEWWNNDFPWVSIADMPENEHITKTKECVSMAAIAEKFSGKIAKAGTLLMSFKLTVGRVSILDIDAVHNEAIISIYPYADSEGTIQDYLFQLLPYISQFGDSKNAIKGKTLNDTSISNLLIPLPPLAEQKRIVAKIEELLPLIDRYEQAWSKLEEFNKRFPVDMQKSILQTAIQGKLVPQLPEEGTGEELYQQIQAEKQRLIKAGTIKAEKPLPEITEDEIPFDIPESWKWVRFNNLCSVLTCGYASTPTYVSEDDGMPFISAKNVKPYRFMPDDHNYISYELYDKLTQNAKPEKGDILLTRVGAGIGEAAIIDTDLDFAIYVSLTLIKLVNNSLIDNRYVLYWLNSPIGVSSAKKNIYGKNASQGNLNVKNVRDFLVPLPPLAEQKRIVEKLEQLLPLCERLK